MRDYLRRTLSGQLPLFSLGADNAVVQVGAGWGWAGRGVPAWRMLGVSGVAAGVRLPACRPLHARLVCSPPARPPAPSGDPPAAQLLGKGAPRIAESQVDSKKELERALKTTCEAFIMAATKLTVEPLLSFITKARRTRTGPELIF